MVGHLRVPLLVLPVPLVMSVDGNKYCIDAHQSTVRLVYNDVNQGVGKQQLCSGTNKPW